MLGICAMRCRDLNARWEGGDVIGGGGWMNAGERVSLRNRVGVIRVIESLVLARWECEGEVGKWDMRRVVVVRLYRARQAIQRGATHECEGEERGAGARPRPSSSFPSVKPKGARA